MLSGLKNGSVTEKNRFLQMEGFYDKLENIYFASDDFVYFLYGGTFSFEKNACSLETEKMADHEEAYPAEHKVHF